MNILITGGAGFIGKYLAEKLAITGNRVYVFDDLSRGVISPKVNSNISFIQGDILDKSSITASTKGVDTVVHLAAINGTDNFYKKSQAVTKVGVIGTANVIEACEVNGIQNFIFASSAEVYNQAKEIPTDENVALTIPNMKEKRFSYGGSKIAGELLTVNWAAEVLKRALIFRPHNVYGPNMGFEHVIPQLIEKSLRLSHQDSDSKLIIQGSGQETRAFCYVDDVVRGIEILIEKGINGEIYNIGNPVETKIETVTGEILKILNLKLEIEQSLLKSGSPLRRCPSIDKISRLGFKPEVDLADGIRQTVNWYKNYFELNRNTYDG